MGENGMAEAEKPLDTDEVFQMDAEETTELDSLNGDEDCLSDGSHESEYSQCRSTNFGSTRSFYQSPESDFMFGNSDITSYFNESGGSGDAFVDALDEYFDAEKDQDNLFGLPLRGTGLYNEDEECLDTHETNEGQESLRNALVVNKEGLALEAYINEGGLDINPESLRNGLEVDTQEQEGLRSHTEDVRDPLQVDAHEVVSSKHVRFSYSVEAENQVSMELVHNTLPLLMENGNEKEEEEVRFDDKHPLESKESLQESEVAATTHEREESLREKRKCVMRLGSKEAEELLKMDMEEIVKPIRLASLQKPENGIDWSREHLGPDELSRYVETLNVQETYMDTVYDMEEILLDNGESSRSWTRKSPTRTPSSVYDGLWKVDSVEVIGAKQRRGSASLGERMVGVREHTIYKIRVRSSGNEWEIERRYREFMELFHQLKRMFGNQSRVQLPSPWLKVTAESRKIFGNTSPDVVEIRSALIQVCLQSSLQAGVPVSTAAPLLRFLFPNPGERRLPMLLSSPSAQFDNEGKLSRLTSTASNEMLVRSSSSPPSMQLNELGASSDRESLTPLGRTIRLIVHTRPRKPIKQQLVDQRGLCAGCYERLTVNYGLINGLAKGLGLVNTGPRFCEYTGQLFCGSCHINETAVLPALVLKSWDFTPRPVSQLAKAYLDSIYDQPMLCVSAVNPFLYSRVPILAHVSEMRKKLSQLVNCIKCPSRSRIQQLLATRRYLLEQNDFYALRDLADLSKGAFSVLPGILQATLEKLSLHITRKCSVCVELGEPCGVGALCTSLSELIYPYEDEDVRRCQQCNTPYHKSCFKMIEACRICIRDSPGYSSTQGESSGQSPSRSQSPRSSSVSVLDDGADSVKQPKKNILSVLFGSKLQERRSSSGFLSMSALLGPGEL